MMSPLNIIREWLKEAPGDVIAIFETLNLRDWNSGLNGIEAVLSWLAVDVPRKQHATRAIASCIIIDGMVQLRMEINRDDTSRDLSMDMLESDLPRDRKVIINGVLGRNLRLMEEWREAGEAWVQLRRSFLSFDAIKLWAEGE